MGRTVPSFRPMLEGEIKRIEKFGRALNGRDKEVLSGLIGYMRMHGDAGSYALFSDIGRYMLLSVALELKKAINALEERVGIIEKILRENKMTKKAEGGFANGDRGVDNRDVDR